MKSNLYITVAAIAVLATGTAIGTPAAESRVMAPPAAFLIIDESALAAYDAFADRLQVEHRAEAVTVAA